MATLKKEYKDLLMSMKPEDITATFINDYLADRAEKVDGKLKIIPAKIKTSDTFTLLPGEYFNTEKVLTNAGLFIFNKFFIEESFQKVVGYVNTPVDADVEAGIEKKLSTALLNDVITVEQMVKFLNRMQWFAKQFNSVFSNSFTMNSVKPLPEVVKRKQELLDEHEEILKNGDVVTAVKIEKELTALAKEKLKDDPGMNLYKSGARGSFNNNYKAISVIKGPVFNPTTGKWDFVSSNFIDGINKDEIPVYGNSVVTGAYPKAVGTQVSGYSAKQLTAAFQGIVLDKPGTDCGTTNYLEIKINPWMKNDLRYRYIMERGKLVLLDDENLDKYVGKTVKLRSPMFCKGDKLCSKCAGQMCEKLGITNIGLTTSRAATSLLKMGMKKFHDTTASIVKIDINNITL